MEMINPPFLLFGGIQRSIALLHGIFIFSLITSFSLSYGYDSLDPYGNITITWDFLLLSGDNYDIKVSIYNFQQYRHVERPGWKLGWSWRGQEVIWSMWGAEALEQGNCSKFKGSELPHCCERKPVIIDLFPGATYNKQFSNCCKGGELSSMVQDTSKYLSAFKMTLGAVPNYSTEKHNRPTNFTLGLPGYSCGDPFPVSPTRSSPDGRRWTQALDTWNVTCIYSQFRASASPKCCVSLSAFYNSTIVPCPRCSCGCQGLPGAKCVEPGETPHLLQLPNATEEEEPSPLVTCSQHMCPIRVHWHVKQSYKEYWRVKITISNLNFVKNYSDWTLVVQHPNMRSVTQLFSFNYHPLNQYGNINDTGIFWGIKTYNDMLLTSGEKGNVQTEMLLHKDKGMFTFREGWTFPRRISFNGDECVMPPPDEYPRLPNRVHSATARPSIVFFSFMFLVLVFF